MKKIIILGANGQIARLVRQRLLNETDEKITLYLRNSARINDFNESRETIIEGDVNDYQRLKSAISGQDIVYANLGGEFEPMIKNVVKAMDDDNVNRLIHVTGLGLYHEVPGEFGDWVEKTIGSDIMDDTRRAAKIIEDSDINYTIIRAAYMNNDDEIDYELTKKGEAFNGTIISRKSIADYIMRLFNDSKLDNYASVGIDKPGTDGNRPY